MSIAVIRQAFRLLPPPRRQRGQGLVEFAFIGPIFFISVLGVLESAFVINAQLSIDNAARDGVRIGALCGTAVGDWTDPGGHIFVGGLPPGFSPCPTAIDSTVRDDMGPILRISDSTLTISPAAPRAPYTVDCPQVAAPTGYWAPRGCVIQVTVTFQYQFLLNFLVGPDAPSITLTSQATAVSQ